MALTFNSRSNPRGRCRPLSEINVTPLVDVMLVLLIIFMVTAPLMTSGVSVDLPKTDAKPLNTDSQPLTVATRCGRAPAGASYCRSRRRTGRDIATAASDLA